VVLVKALVSAVLLSVVRVAKALKVLKVLARDLRVVALNAASALGAVPKVVVRAGSFLSCYGV
jgi:hypothetical protein